MQAKIYCRPVAKDVHEFFLVANGKKFYLFEQRFHMTNHLYFKKGVAVDNIGDFSKAKSVTVKNTLEKLPKYIKKAAKRYGIELETKSKRRQKSINRCEWSGFEQVA